MLGLVGLKKGMSRVFKDDGNSIPVTVIKIEDSKIVQRKSQEKDGYFAVQVNYGSKKKVSKSLEKKFTTKNKGYLTEFSVSETEFNELKDILDSHVANFVEKLDFDLDDRDIVLEDMWINILDEGGSHSSHIHPHSVISGTTYVSIPNEAGEIRFEDPRLQFMMSAPPRKKDARTDLKTFHSHHPVAGEVLLWESWLRHEVLQDLHHIE